MLAIVAITFATETVIMLGFAQIGYLHDSLLLGLADAGLLALLVAPPIYWLVLIPVRREYAKRREAEGMAADMGRLAVTDALTRLMNRRGIVVGLLDAMAQSERYGTPLSVAMIDIDHFKDVNDTYGHKAGDQVLTALAAVFVDTLRMPDKVGRYGGEEFLVLLPHTPLAQARKLAERLRVAVHRHAVDLGRRKVKVSVSLGVAQFATGEDMEHLLVRVDRALYEAKAAGRDRVVADAGR